MSDERTLSERIETVEGAEAEGEQLVSVAVPPDESVGGMLERVEEDHAEAEYLDVREEVQNPLKRALEETRRVLNDYEETPENGLAVYVGVVGGDLVTEVFDSLPDPVAETTYGYANEFDATPLGPSTSGTDTHGLVVVARESAVLGRYDGETIEHVETVESDVPSKQAAEGRNEDRFQGRSEERREEFFDEVGDAVARLGFESVSVDGDASDPSSRDLAVAGLVVGGSEVVVDQFHDGSHLPEGLADEVVGPFQVEYSSEAGLRQLVDAAKAEGALDSTDAREAVDRFFDALADDSEPAVGGREDVDEALEYEVVDTLLLAESLPAEDVQRLEERAGEQGGTAVVVPADLDRAERLRESFDGVGAVLRVPIE